MNGDEIRRRREAMGLTQAQLADRLRVGPRTVSGWERNESVPRNRMGMLRELFGVTDDDAEPVDPLDRFSDIALLSELTRRALHRQAND